MSVAQTTARQDHLEENAGRYGRYARQVIERHNGDMDLADVVRLARNAAHYAHRYIRSRRAQHAAFAGRERRLWERAGWAEAARLRALTGPPFTPDAPPPAHAHVFRYPGNDPENGPAYCIICA